MSRRLQRLTGEVIRFSAVNIVATGVSLVLFNALVHGVKGWFGGPMHGHPLTGYLLANSVGMLVSFYGSRYYAFRHRHAAGPGGGLVAYVIVNFASFTIPISILWVSRNVFGWDTIYADNIAGNVIGAVLGMLFRFWAFRKFVFTGQQVLPVAATVENPPEHKSGSLQPAEDVPSGEL
ncbi:GtrA family protein [Marmoricola sp. RAF53]|uniref:GtrA family protein n=1 Tax=Marmoricola sp. RAF53 TaxID=3233059 RepID=UPI003F9622A0